MKKFLLNRALAAKEKITFLVLLFAALVLKGTCAYATVYTGVCGEHLTWTLNSEDSTLVITGRGDMSDWTFGDYASRVYIKHIVFPEGMTSVYGRAFSGCPALESVTLPDSVVSIGKMAFQSCIGIKEVHCGKGLKSIGDSAFIHCTSLEKLELNDGLEYIGYSAFMQDTSLQGTIVFPESLKYLGNAAFGVYSSKARDLTAIWNARSCKHIRDNQGWGAPLYCFSKIVFGEQVVSIPDQLCYATYCDTIILPESVDSIGLQAFASNNKLKYVKMPSSLSHIGQGVFYHCEQLSSIRIPEGVSVLPINAFIYCQKLADVVLPSTLDTIQSSAFSQCLALPHITLPSGIKFIDDYAFVNCNALQDINLPEGLNSIGRSVFRNCTSLESITLPDGVMSIGEYAFADCSALREVNIPNSVRTIEGRAFQNCSLDTLVLPSELNLIGSGAFLSQKKITEVVIPDEVRQIKSNAFEGCSGLSKVVIGKKTAMIDAEAFKNDSAIIEIRSRAAYPPLVQSSTFAGVPDSTWLFVPVQSIAAYVEDPVWGRFRMPKEEEINYVTVDAEETTANFVWPTDSAAHSYQIDIYKDGAVFCKLTLGPKGQLLGIAFSMPGRRAPSSQSESSLPFTLSFLVTGLDEASRYNYVLCALDEEQKPIHVYFGDFATTGYPGDDVHGDGLEVIPTPPIIPSNPEGKPQGVDNILIDQIHHTKIIVDGQIYLIYEGRMYDVRGNQIK